ncbi:uncharacterized protein C1orf87-like [Pleurodeles waltl]|uniref:uncharacterized protein C1orf87-like n=1 Tax=Pleurodeles waltl TaxID=8319 RepID=UPI00370978BA
MFVELLHKAHLDANLQLPEGREKKGLCSMSIPHNDHLQIQQKYLDRNKDNDNGPTSRPSTQPIHQVAELSDSKHHESWIDRFGKLEKALSLCDTQNTGKIEKERAKRLIHNYNHIYNLALSPLRIDQALRKFHCGDSVTLEPVFQYLKEL